MVSLFPSSPALPSVADRRASPLLFLLLALLAACSPGGVPTADSLNDQAYYWHYRNVDSTEHYARLALHSSPNYATGQAEAMNNLAFVRLVRMDYDGARRILDSIPIITDNQIEMLVGYVQQMRLCQRRSANREFYDYREQATRCLQRIDEDRSVLTPRQQRRMLYAESEMAIVTSTYYYYVGLERQSSETMLAIAPGIERDTAQYLNYLYNVGAGGIITAGSQTDISQQEFDHLMRCHLLARHTGCVFFEANALEAMAEHLINPASRSMIIADNLPAMKFLNPDGVSDDSLPLWLSGKALDMFSAYGDTYQIAGAYRTLASCYLAQDDYQHALDCLQMSLSDTIIEQAPDLVASIREQMSVAFAAVDNKVESDRNRNIYLDLQEQTRQDRQLEARAGQLEQSLSNTSRMLWAVIATIVVLVAVVAFYYQWRRRRADMPDGDMEEREEQLREQIAVMRLRVEQGERRHLEQRAKVSLITGITPFIDRILHTISRLAQSSPAGTPLHEQRMEYAIELTDEINRQNTLLTNWIQLRQGELSLHIETFPLQDLLDMVRRSEQNFASKGITLSVLPSTASVKADRVLTLFMLNTLADNARKFTPQGGSVTISTTEASDYVEISVSDTGCGIDQQTLAHIFEQSHGFGLRNCKGIMEKYRKMSAIFRVCTIAAESTVGVGSRFFFRLPKGTLGRMGHIGIISLVCLMSFATATAQPTVNSLDRAASYADSAYFSNVYGYYERALLFADSCRQCLNDHFRQHHPGSADTLLAVDDLAAVPTDIRWFHDSIDCSYSTILDMRNESAVAALALHKWNLYQYNNRIYTQLFKELSADNSLDDYCRKMQLSQTNRQVAAVMLVLLFICILAAVAWQMVQMLSLSERRRRQQQERLDALADELQRLTMENNALHVSNAVLDNTLSTLKHETMYYPSRIRQAVEQRLEFHELQQLVSYYRELYGLLSAQSLDQVQRCSLHLKPLHHGILGDENLINFLFDILKRENAQQPPTVEYATKDEKYVECRATMTALRRTDLFTPSDEANIPWLLCRQIVRDHGEATNRRACAIRAEAHPNATIIVITLPKSPAKSQ